MTNPDCPCRRAKCPRHGDCDACREHHNTSKHSPTACDRMKAKAERKANRRERKSEQI